MLSTDVARIRSLSSAIALFVRYFAIGSKARALRHGSFLYSAGVRVVGRGRSIQCDSAAEAEAVISELLAASSTASGEELSRCR